MRALIASPRSLAAFMARYPGHRRGWPLVTPAHRGQPQLETVPRHSSRVTVPRSTPVLGVRLPQSESRTWRVIRPVSRRLSPAPATDRRWPARHPRLTPLKYCRLNASMAGRLDRQPGDSARDALSGPASGVSRRPGFGPLPGLRLLRAPPGLGGRISESVSRRPYLRSPTRHPRLAPLGYCRLNASLAGRFGRRPGDSARDAIAGPASGVSRRPGFGSLPGPRLLQAPPGHGGRVSESVALDPCPLLRLKSPVRSLQSRAQRSGPPGLPRRPRGKTDAGLATSAAGARARPRRGADHRQEWWVGSCGWPGAE